MLTATKGDESQESSAIIIILELDIPILSVDINQQFLINVINLQDIIGIKLIPSDD